MSDFVSSGSNPKVFESDKKTGTATASYPGTPQARWINANLLSNKVLTIHNRSTVNLIVFKLYVYDIQIDDIGHEYPGFGDGDAQTIAPSTDPTNPSAAYLNLPETFYSIEIYLKSASGSAYAMYVTGQFI